MKNICVLAGKKKSYNLELEKEIHEMEMYIVDILKEDKSELQGEVKQQLFFKYEPHITRRDLARILRSLAYKIQHYEDKGDNLISGVTAQ